MIQPFWVVPGDLAKFANSGDDALPHVIICRDAYSVAPVCELVITPKRVWVTWSKNSISGNVLWRSLDDDVPHTW